MDIENRAEELAECLLGALYTHGDVQQILDLVREAVAEVTPPPDHILTPDGVVRKVLGDLPITKDGMVIGDDCEVFYQGGSVRAECFRSPLPGESDWYPYHPHKAWSTREAAEAASKEVSGG